MLKYKASSAKCRLLFITLQADSQLWGKSSGIWAKMSSVYEYVARISWDFQQKPLGVVVSTQVWCSWGSKIKPGHGQVLLEWKLNFKIADQLTSDLWYQRGLVYEKSKVKFVISKFMPPKIGERISI